MISILDNLHNKHTLFKKIKENLWEFDIKIFANQCNFKKDNFALNVPNSTIDKEGLEDYIQILKKILENKPIKIGRRPEGYQNHNLKWVKNYAEIFLKSSYMTLEEVLFDISFFVKNKYLGNIINSADMHVIPESFSGAGFYTTEENLLKYISELEAEIKDVMFRARLTLLRSPEAGDSH
ncbi:MAG: hypothetical protein ACOC1K_07755 [Nanoarchaeota archaeon]